MSNRKRDGRLKQNGLTASESAAFKKLSCKGNVVLRNGWPDFLVIGDGGTPFAVEVKTKGYRRNPSQEKMFDALTKMGISVLLFVDGDWMSYEPDRSLS